jgi:hypothetical protein
MQGQFYRGVQQVPVSKIIGSVDRYHDFDRRFLPTQSHTRPRWESVDIAHHTDVQLPPVQLYKVGEAYFVKDGNHRVSVAKEQGADYIDAEVIDCPTTVPLPVTISGQQELLLLAEYARFLEQPTAGTWESTKTGPSTGKRLCSTGTIISTCRW